MGPVRLILPMKAPIEVRRLYDSLQPESDDGYRVFIDRLWPRGVSRDAFHFDLWCKELAPTPELRKWFAHKAQNWAGFSDKYRAELRNSEQQELIRQVLEQAGKRKVVLLYGARDPDHNHAIILAEEMQRRR